MSVSIYISGSSEENSPRCGAAPSKCVLNGAEGCPGTDTTVKTTGAMKVPDFSVWVSENVGKIGLLFFPSEVNCRKNLNAQPPIFSSLNTMISNEEIASLINKMK